MANQSPSETTVSKIKTVYVPSDLKKEVKDRIIQCMAIIAAKGIKMAMPSISFDLRGKTAGKAYLQKNHIQLNAVLLVENREKFVSDTVGHEFAHLVTHFLYKGKAQAHGPEWKAIMLLLGQKPDRCHSFKTDNSSVLKTYQYVCACKTHLLSSRQHNNGRLYSCKLCKKPLVLAGKNPKLVLPGITSSEPPEKKETAPVFTSPVVAKEDRPPTEAMINFAKAISLLTGVLLTDDILKSFTKTKVYIDLNKNKKPEAPTDKQLNFASFLAKKLGLVVPPNVLKSKIALSGWIALHQEKKPG